MSQPIKLDGAALAKLREDQLKQLFEQFDQQFRRDHPDQKVPILTIASLYNQDHEPSLKYSEMKRQAAGRIGINFQLVPYSSQTSHDELAELIQEFAADPDVQGMMLQLPVPEPLNILQDDLIKLIPPTKDIDGLLSNSPYLPATVKGVETLLDELITNQHHLQWTELPVAVLGASGVVGSATIKMLQDRGVVNIAQIDLDTSVEDRVKLLSQSELIISTTGQENTQDPTEIKEGAIWINVGLGKASDELIVKTRFYTPNVGGVGPMTVQSLMENGQQAFFRSYQ